MNAVASACEWSIQFRDLRTMKKTNSIGHAHVRIVDYDTKKKHILVTAEAESGICMWNLRIPKVPIIEVPGHRDFIKNLYNSSRVYNPTIIMKPLRVSTLTVPRRALHRLLHGRSRRRQRHREANGECHFLVSLLQERSHD